MKQLLSTKAAPSAIGPYSQAIAAGSFIFVSGQIGVDPATGAFAGGGTAEQTARAIENMKAILAEKGLGLSAVVKTTVFLADMVDFSAMNGVYAGYFPEPYPARSAVQVAKLPKGARVEIEAIAVIG